MKSSDIRGASLSLGVPLLFRRVDSTFSRTFKVSRCKDKCNSLVSLKSIGAECAEGLENDGEEKGWPET